MNGRDYWKDRETDLFFFKHDLVLDHTTVDQVRPHLDAVKRDPHQSEIFEIMEHEQRYLRTPSDFLRRWLVALEWLAENNYKPCFYEEGFLGSPV
jgi:hypothetical protein